MYHEESNFQSMNNNMQLDGLSNLWFKFTQTILKEKLSNYLKNWQRNLDWIELKKLHPQMNSSALLWSDSSLHVNLLQNWINVPVVSFWRTSSVFSFYPFGRMLWWNHNLSMHVDLAWRPTLFPGGEICPKNVYSVQELDHSESAHRLTS